MIFMTLLKPDILMDRLYLIIYLGIAVMLLRHSFYYPSKSLFKLIEKNQLVELKKALKNGVALKTYSLKNIVLHETVFHAAARMNRINCLKILLSYYPKNKFINVIAVYFYSKKAPQCITPLQLAIQKKHKHCESLIMQYMHKKNKVKRLL